MGMTYYCATSRRGKFRVGRKLSRKRVGRTLRRIWEALRMRMHLGEHEVAIWLGRVIRGWLNYYAVPGTSRTLANFVQTIKRKCCAFCADACRKIATVGQHWTALQASIGLNPPSVTCGLASGLSSTPEVGAGCVNAHARICAGGLGQPSFLQR